MTVRVTVCGTLTVVRDGEQLTGPRLGSRKARVLTAALASGRGSPVAVDRLVEAVWGDEPPQDPQGNLATLASRLRRVVGDGFITQSGTTYALTRDVDLDLDAVSALLDAATARLGRGEPTLAVAAAQRALGLLGEDGSLATECDGDWADPLRREAATLCREARHVLATAATATGQADVAEQAGLDAVRADAYDERAHRDLMTALTVAGRATAALDVYAGLAGRLAEELGTDPDPETQALHVHVLRGDRVAGPATGHAGRAAVAAGGPGRGAVRARPGVGRGVGRRRRAGGRRRGARHRQDPAAPGGRRPRRAHRRPRARHPMSARRAVALPPALPRGAASRVALAAGERAPEPARRPPAGVGGAAAGPR